MKNTKKYAIKYENRMGRYGLYFAIPGIIGFIIFSLIPLLYTVYTSFTDATGSFVLFSNYTGVFESEAFVTAMSNTGIFFVVGGGIAIVLSFMIAWVMFSLVRDRVRGSGALKVWYLMPMILPTAVSVIFAQLLFETDGAINSLFGTDIDWLNTSPYTFIILVVLYIWKNFGYFIIIYISAFSRIAPEVYEAARVEGAGPIKMLTKIVIPQIKSSTFFVVIMSIIGVFKMNRESYLLFGNYPSESSYMFQNFITNNIERGDFGRASAASAILFIIFAVLVYLLFMISEKE